METSCSQDRTCEQDTEPTVRFYWCQDCLGSMTSTCPCSVAPFAECCNRYVKLLCRLVHGNTPVHPYHSLLEVGLCPISIFLNLWPSCSWWLSCSWLQDNGMHTIFTNRTADVADHLAHVRSGRGWVKRSDILPIRIGASAAGGQSDGGRRPLLRTGFM